MIAMTMQKFHLMAALWLAGAAAGAAAQTAGTTVMPAPAGAKPAAVTATPAVNGARSASAPVLVVKPAASAPVPGKRQTRPLTAAEKRESAASPGELRPERTITPQITIPLGKTPPDAARTTPGTSTGTGTGKTGKPSGSAVNDSAGRCAAIADENERAKCRDAAGLGKPKK